jgi:hypothetical protein
MCLPGADLGVNPNQLHQHMLHIQDEGRVNLAELCVPPLGVLLHGCPAAPHTLMHQTVKSPLQAICRG